MTDQPKRSGTKSADSTQLGPQYLGPYPVTLGENTKTFKELLADIVNFYKPNDPIEWIIIRDISDLQWQLQQLRRLVAGCLDNAKVDGVERLLNALDHSSFAESVDAFDPEGEQENPDAPGLSFQRVTARELAVRYIKNDEWARAQVTEVLQKFDLSEEAFVAETMSMRIADIERMTRSAASHQASRDEAIRNLRIHRANVAGLRRSELQIEDPDGQNKAA